MRFGLIISHRGNLSGPNTAHAGENHPESIQKVLDMGYGCEIDVRWVEGKGYYLGHDKAEYPIGREFLHVPNTYLHCKDIQTLYKMQLEHLTCIRAFFHHQDDVTLISNCKFLWSYPKKEVLLTPLSIAVLPELVPDWPNLEKCWGICTDYPLNYEIDK